MKNTKKLASLALALILALTLSIPAFAAGNGSITVDNATVGQEYTIYRIFDLKSFSGGNFAYQVNPAWDAFIQQDAIKAYVTVNPENGGVTWIKDADADVAAFAKLALDYATANTIAPIKTATAEAPTTAEATTVTFSNLDLGYYLVDSSLGALCSLNTTTPTVKIEDKNDVPTLDKEVKTDTTSPDPKTATASIGDVVNYTVTVKDGAGTDTAIVVSDKMTAGLTLNQGSFAITVDGNAVDKKNYEVDTKATDTYTFQITFNDAYIESLDTGKKIVITYNAVLNEKAVISGADGKNENSAWLDYAHTTSVKHPTNVTTYKFDLDKTDKDSAALTGAKFELYDAKTDGNKIPLVKDGETYRPAVTGETGVAIEVGSATIKGLAAGTYYLEETVAPDGYNLLAERVEVNLTKNLVRTNVDGSVVAYGVRVINETGSVLPTTGGIGTTIFYVLGGLLAVGAVVVLVTRKRVDDSEM